MARLERKLQILSLTLILNFFGYACLLISFVTPYWIISWPSVYSGIRRMGLWEICFDGLMHENDRSQKTYGCWSFWSSELYEISSFLMPQWFQAVKFIITLCSILELPICGANIKLWLILIKQNNSNRKKKAPHNLVQFVTWATYVTAIMKTISILIFGFAYKYDPFWLPRPEIKYPYFSYGLAILSAILGIFSSIGHFILQRIDNSTVNQINSSITLF